MNDTELLVVLGFYYIGKEKGIDGFVSQFNACFGKDYSAQTLIHEVSIFRNIDPANNVKRTRENKKHQALWNEFIGKEKIIELKEIYKCFKNGDYIPLEQANGGRCSGLNEKPLRAFDGDAPRTIVGTVDDTVERYKRDKAVLENALSIAGYACEGECGNDLFLRKDGRRDYTEGHHLIPLKYQKYFPYSLDVEANVVSLCPMCHRLLHYGYENRSLLRKLYDVRKDRLEKAGLEISFEKLLFMYASEEIEDDI